MKSTNSLSDFTHSRIICLIWQQKSISRVEIASILGIDKSTVTKNVAILKNTGIIRELSEGTTGPQGGRKPIFLEINASYACLGGIEINSERFVCTLVDLHGKMMFQHQKVISPEIFSYLGCKGVFEEAHAMIVSQAKKLDIPLIGIGVGMPGLINSDKGIIIQSESILIHEEYNFLEDIKATATVPILVNNDARCCCYSEQIISRNQTLKDMLFLLIEYRLTEAELSAKKNLAIGIGLVLNGKIFKGTEYLAGEFRSILWTKGLHGQFHARVDMQENTVPDTISVHAAYKELSQHIAFLVNILNLQAVYIGGSEHQSAQNIQSQILEQIAYLRPHDFLQTCIVRAASVGSLSVAYGAAAMCLDSLFVQPTMDSAPRTKNSIGEYLKKVKKMKKSEKKALQNGQEMV